MADSLSAGVHKYLCELQQTILSYLLISTILLGGVEAWITLTPESFSVLIFLFWLSPCLIGVGGLAFRNRNLAAARHLFVWGSLLWFLFAVVVFPHVWIPFFGVAGILITSLLVAGSELVFAAAVYGLAGAFVWTGLRSYPLSDLLLALGIGLLLSFILRRTLLLALEWSWSSQMRSDQLLRETREHRADLIRAMKSLETTSAIQRKIEDELLIARKHADEARRMKERFAANISHELRTPLNLILGFSEVMYKSPETYGKVTWTPTIRRDIYQIYRSSEHLLKMIDDILDLSRFEMADFSLYKESVPISQTIMEAVEISRGLFSGSDVLLETNLSPDLPILSIDVTRIRQVIINLLKNARSFTSKGYVKVSARMEKSRVVISVKDTGEGIPTEKLSAIFEEFYQVDQSRSRKQQGAGLGLAICKRLVEAHEGSIWAESQEGIGTEFFFTLPLPSQRYHPHSLITSDLGQVLQPITHPCVLFVEKDPAMVSMLSRRIGDLEIIQVQVPSLLNEYIARYRPRAVIINTFPGNTEPIRIDANGSLPVIQISLLSQAFLAKELGISRCLTKPVTFSQLMECMAYYDSVKDILIIDDDREFVQLMSRYLQSSGVEYKIRFAYDGDEGWRSLCQQPPDLVMLDVIMPDRDGFEIVAEMEHTPSLSKTKILLISGTDFEEKMKEKYKSQMHIERKDGLSLAQVLACVKVLINTPP
jgi:signal transduction histidine kinase